MKKKKLRCLSQLMISQTRKTWVNNLSQSLTQVSQSNQTKEKFWIQLHPQQSRPHLLNLSSIPLFNHRGPNLLKTTPKFQARSARQPHRPLQHPKNLKLLPNHPRLLSDPLYPRVNLYKNAPFLPQIILSLRTIWNPNLWQLHRNKLCKTGIANNWQVRMPAIVCHSSQEIYPASKVNSQHPCTIRNQYLPLSFYHLSLNLRKPS